MSVTTAHMAGSMNDINVYVTKVPSVFIILQLKEGTHGPRYRPQTKLGQGNIFRSVCQDFCPQGDPRGAACSGGCLILGGCLLPGGGCLLPNGGAWWRPPPRRPLLRAVRILLECILVLVYLWYGKDIHTSELYIIKFINYRPPMKLREGHVFTSVCQSFCPRGWVGMSRGWVLTPRVSTHVSTWVLTHWGGYPPRRIRGPWILQDTTDKRSAHILVECFLVFLYFYSFTDNTAIKVYYFNL